MKIAGIICEYDPFHKGHFHQIEMLRARGFDTVICLMSGNATQRGAFACADKYTRAYAASCAGADLVLELPYPYSSASAEFFATAGVYILDSIGVDEINFGSECGDIELLRSAARVISSSDFEKVYREISNADKTKGAFTLMCEAYKSLTGENFPSSSNDILAMSYLAAAEKIGCRAELYAVKREGSDFTQTELSENEYPSATGIRRLFASNEYEKAFSFMPEKSVGAYKEALLQESFPTDVRSLESAILSFFRLASQNSLEGFAESGGGLANRICKCACASTSLDTLFSLCATKRYTDARIRRAILYCMTGVTEEDIRSLPEYTTLLAIGKNGREFLAKNRKSGDFNIVTKPSVAPECRQKELSDKLDALFTLTMKKARPSNEFLRAFPKISKND